MAYGFDIALSALNATTSAINVTANNLANLNTTGFKESQISFEDLYAQTLGLGLANQTQSGFGVATSQIRHEFTQGSPETTGGNYDAAIEGDGFFVIQNANGNQLLTRDGSFSTNSNGDLIDANGGFVQGWTQTGGAGAVNTNGPIGKIQIPTGSLRPPAATQNFEINTNLNSAASADGTSTFSTPIQVTDSLGGSQTLTATFTKTGSNAWSYSVSVPASALSTTSTTTNPVATGNLTFDTSGALTSPAATPPSVLNQIPISITGLADGAADLNINWNLSDPTTGVSQITQIAEPSAVSTTTQDGIAAAQLTQVGVGTGGEVIAKYSDGEEQQVGQIALAEVRNPESLTSVGNNDYQLSAATAAPVIGTPGTGGRGNILGGELESSNVDIATEFTNLIVYQRSYEANAKVVTSEDQLSQDTIAIKQ